MPRCRVRREGKMAVEPFTPLVRGPLRIAGSSPSRARQPGRGQFLVWLVGFTIVLTVLALLQFHGAVNIPALEANEQTEVDEVTGEEFILRRLCSTGIYHDPNDLCLILVVGIVVCLYQLAGGRSRLFRLVWLAPIGLFGYALSLTQSRGGFIALLGALLT